jgi:hypothetical protein
MLDLLDPADVETLRKALGACALSLAGPGSRFSR